MSRKFELRSVFVADLAADRRDAADSEIRKVVGLVEQRASDPGLVDHVGHGCRLGRTLAGQEE